MIRLVAMYAKFPATEADFETAAQDITAPKLAWGCSKNKDLEKLKETELTYVNVVFELVHWCCGIRLWDRAAA